MESTQDLERAERMLSLQTQINGDLEAEIADLTKAHMTVVDDLRHKLREARKQTEARQSRLNKVEAQLKDTLYSQKHHSESRKETTSGTQHKSKMRNKPDSEHALLVPGTFGPNETIVEVWIKEGKLQGDSKQLNTFVLVDFFDFETQSTKLHSALTPRYNFASTFKVISC